MKVIYGSLKTRGKETEQTPEYGIETPRKSSEK